MSIGGMILCTSEGRLCFYRNYGGLPHSTFEDFAFAFAAVSRRAGRQTFLLHGAHRLTYLPLEGFYIALATTRASNAIEDIATLNNAKEAVLCVTAGRLTEEAIAECHAALAFAFDDMISMNQRNVFSRAQISALLEMESANEKLQKAILLNKEKETRRRAQDEIRRQERERRRKGALDAGDTLGSASYSQTSTRGLSPAPAPEKAAPRASSRGKGLRLGRGRAKQPARAPSPPKEAAPDPEFDPLAEEVEVVLQEKVSGDITSSGEWRDCELRGSLTLTVLNPRLERTAIKFQELRLPAGVTAKIPPSYDKQRWAEGLLILRDTAAAPAPHAPVECLKYGFKLLAGDGNMPFKLTTWFNERETSLEVDFNSQQSLFPGFDRLELEVPLPERAGPRVSDYTDSEVVMGKRGFTWVVAPLDATNASASVVISTKRALTPDEIFPAELRLESKRTALRFSRLTLRAGEREPAARVSSLLSSQGLNISD